MKRRDVLAHLTSHGCKFRREGSRHTVYFSAATNRTSTIPRHQEIDDKLVRKICRDLGIPKPN